MNAVVPLYSRENPQKQWLTSDRRKVKPKRREIEDAVRISNTGNEDITVHDEDAEEIFADGDDGTT